MASRVPGMWLDKGAIVMMMASQRPIPAQVTCGLK